MRHTILLFSVFAFLCGCATQNTITEGDRDSEYVQEIGTEAVMHRVVEMKRTGNYQPVQDGEMERYLEHLLFLSRQRRLVHGDPETLPTVPGTGAPLTKESSAAEIAGAGDAAAKQSKEDHEGGIHWGWLAGALGMAGTLALRLTGLGVVPFIGEFAKAVIPSLGFSMNKQAALSVALQGGMSVAEKEADKKLPALVEALVSRGMDRVKAEEAVKEAAITGKDFIKKIVDHVGIQPGLSSVNHALYRANIH